MSDQTQLLARFGVVPVLAIERVSDALPLGDALLSGGLPVAEITFRTAAAAEVIRVLSDERPDLLIGAGTVLTTQQVEAAKNAGARFAVAPGLNPEVVRAARDVGLPFFPGVMTPSDVEKALSLDCRMMKFFPAAQAGGPEMLKALSAPYAHTGLRFMPTGGVTLRNLEDYLRLPTVVAVGGTWIAKSDAISGGAWAEIAANAREAKAAVDAIRSA